MGIVVVRLQHLFLAPLVTLPIPSQALLGQGVTLSVLVGVAGFSGVLLARPKMAMAASLSLLALLVWGKIASNIVKTSSPDTVVLLTEFIGVLVLMEASASVLTFTREDAILGPRRDEPSDPQRTRLQTWLQRQLSSLARLGLVVVGLSMGLILVAGSTSIPSNQIVFSATLALTAIVLLLFLVLYRREPRDRKEPME